MTDGTHYLLPILLLFSQRLEKNNISNETFGKASALKKTDFVKIFKKQE